MPNRFVQLHLLTFYGPANLNRDDTGRPKTAMIGGVERLRISSQSLKRAVRTSDAFQEALDGNLGVRSRNIGRQEILEQVIKRTENEKASTDAVKKIMAEFTKGKSDRKKASKDKSNDELQSSQVLFLSPSEIAKLVDTRRGGGERERGVMENHTQGVLGGLDCMRYRDVRQNGFWNIATNERGCRPSRTRIFNPQFED